MNIDKEMDELIKLLDDNKSIKRIKQLKLQITDNELELINNYRNNPTVSNKKILYDNKIINEYLICESNINYLIMGINNKFKRSKICQR